MPEPSTHFARQQEYVFDYDHRASEKHLGGLESIDCGWALVIFCHQFWESIDHSVEGTKCRALRALLTKRHVHFEFVFFSRDVTSKVTPP